MLELYDRDGVYWVRGRAADGDDYIRRSLRTSDEEIAAAKVRALEAEARKRRILGPDAPKPEDSITFAACVKHYDGPERDRRFLVPIVRRIGQMKVREITPASVRKLAKELHPYAASDTWQRQVVTPIRAVINNAHELGLCAPIRVKAFSKEERVKQDAFRGGESRVPKTPGSWPWLLAFCAVAEPRDAALAYFMFRHGYRVGQCLPMTRSKDMDLSNAKVRVHASKGHPAHWAALDPEEVAMIANLPLPYRGAARDRVFGIGGGRSGALYRRWKDTCARAGIEYLPPHSSGRHGYGTEMVVRQNVNPVDAAEGRWSSPSVLLKTYAHPQDSEAVVREAFMAGRTQAVQQKTSKPGKALRGNAK